eukprot:10118742-Alexandrium_andersonii.AAC.1
MDFRGKRIAQAGDVAGQLRPRLAPKAEELHYSLSLVPERGNFWFPGGMAKDASGPAAREACGPPAPGA